jgi:hypothetical protein
MALNKKQKQIKMRNFFDKLGAVCIGLFTLFLLEGLISLGMFLKFEEYNTLAWIMQGMAVYTTCWASIRLQEAGGW